MLCQAENHLKNLQFQMLTTSCRLAHSQYVKAIEDFKKVKVNHKKNQNRKLKVDEINEVTGKKGAVQSNIKKS